MTRENRCARRKRGPSVSLSTTNPSLGGPGSNVSLFDERPAVNRFRRGAHPQVYVIDRLGFRPIGRTVSVHRAQGLNFKTYLIYLSEYASFHRPVSFQQRPIFFMLVSEGQAVKSWKPPNTAVLLQTFLMVGEKSTFTLFNTSEG